MNRIIAWANQPKPPYGLAIFRILFGLIMLWDLKRIHDIKIIDSFFPRGIIFPYEFIQLPLLDEALMHFLLYTLMICTVFITIGFFYRISMLVFAIGFSYFFLLDQTLYNNHLYLICLLSFLMTTMPADSALSLAKRKHKNTIPQWSYRLLQFQFVVVFFFGGITKLNPFWLDLHPVKELLQDKIHLLGVGLVATSIIEYAMCYVGIIFDLSIGFLLWIPKTRKWAFFGALVFNLSNAYIFDDIYIFPFFMIGALILFLDQKWIKNELLKWKIVKKTSQETLSGKLNNVTVFIIAIYVFFQLISPLRHYAIDGYTDWTGEGQRFAWRMKIQHRKIIECDFALFDLDNKKIHKIKVGRYLYADEIQFMCISPSMIIQFAHYLKKEAAEKNKIFNCLVKSKIKVEFNGLPGVYIFHPDIDLLTESEKHDSFNDWITPLSEAGKKIERDKTSIPW
jgi:hypothetical protein